MLTAPQQFSSKSWVLQTMILWRWRHSKHRCVSESLLDVFWLLKLLPEHSEETVSSLVWWTQFSLWCVAGSAWHQYPGNEMLFQQIHNCFSQHFHSGHLFFYSRFWHIAGGEFYSSSIVYLLNSTLLLHCHYLFCLLILLLALTSWFYSLDHCSLSWTP